MTSSQEDPSSGAVGRVTSPFLQPIAPPMSPTLMGLGGAVVPTQVKYCITQYDLGMEVFKYLQCVGLVMVPP